MLSIQRYSRSRWSQSLAQLSVLFILYEIISSAQQFQIMNYILFTIHISLCDSTIWWDMFCKHQIYSRISTCFCFSLSSIRSVSVFFFLTLFISMSFSISNLRARACGCVPIACACEPYNCACACNIWHWRPEVNWGTPFSHCPLRHRNRRHHRNPRSCSQSPAAQWRARGSGAAPAGPRYCLSPQWWYSSTRRNISSCCSNSPFSVSLKSQNAIPIDSFFFFFFFYFGQLH